MTDLHKAEAAFRAGLAAVNPHTLANEEAELYERGVALLAALDAARGEVVGYGAIVGTTYGKPTFAPELFMLAQDAAEEYPACPVAPLYAAPPAALAVPADVARHAAAAVSYLDHAGGMPAGLSLALQRLRAALAQQPAALAVPDGLRNAEQTLALLIRKYGDESDAAALAMLAQQPAALAVPEGYALVPVEPTDCMLDAAFYAAKDDRPSDRDLRAAWAAMLVAANKENNNG